MREGVLQSQGAAVFSIAGEFDYGNIQIDETPARIFGPHVFNPRRRRFAPQPDDPESASGRDELQPYCASGWRAGGRRGHL